MSAETYILIYGDSLSMPRTAEGVGYSDLYAEKFRFWLQEHYPQAKAYLVNRSRGSMCISNLHIDFLADYPYFEAAKDKILIIQSGIVDCVPRPIPDWLKFIISILPSFARRPIAQLLHNNRARLLRNGFKWRATPPHVFRSVFKQWLDFAVDRFSKIYVVSILPTNQRTEVHSPGYSKGVEVYNVIMKHVIRRVAADNVWFLDLHRLLSSKPELLGAAINQKDGHHLTPAGHDCIFKALTEVELMEGKSSKKR